MTDNVAILNNRIEQVSGKKSLAQKFCEEMAKVAHSYEKSKRVSAGFAFKNVRFKEHNDRRGLRFEDGSKIFFGDEGKLILPIENNTP